MSEYICRIKNITKEFPGVKALNQISFDIKKGEIHAIIGENGAGKSTLMNILSGVYQQSGGELEIGGEIVHFTSTKMARQKGVSMIHQELSLAAHMTVAENVFQGRMLRNKWGLVDRKSMYQQTRAALERLGAGYIPVNELISNLGISQKQLVEIAKAISMNARLLIMDEPTASLTAKEIEFLLEVMCSLKKEGVAILFITHKLEEVLAVADTISVLRDGEYITCLDPKETDISEMIHHMVGRKGDVNSKREFMPNEKDISEEEIVLEVKGLTVPGRVENVSFQLRKGEVLGLTGLVGAGRSELLNAIFGYYGQVKGEILLNGEHTVIHNCTDAIGKGIGLVPENRKEAGLFLKMSVRDNMVLVHARTNSKGPFMNMKATSDIAEEYVEKLSIKTPGIMQQIVNLSGGNQQKTIIARWLMQKPDILLLDEPTHGIDVGAKEEIYALIDDIARQGISVILLSSELPEIIRMSDRIMVMHQGRLKGILKHEEAQQVKIMNLIFDQEEKTAV